MFAVAYLVLVGFLAYQLQSRITLLASFRGLPRYLCSLGLTLFLVNWANFLLYVVIGWGALYTRVTCGALVLLVLSLSGIWRTSPPDTQRSPVSPKDRRAVRKWNFWFLFLAVFVLARFYAGLDVDDDDNVWSAFNFVDTAFHLSVVNAFLGAHHFPPMDLDMAPYPLKYHFLADFHVAFLVRLGLSALSAMWTMNLISASVMVGTLWATFQSWLKLPARWVMLAGLIFLFLNSALLNLIHYLVLHPPFLDPNNLFYGLLRFPYFNFESALANMLEPQRGLLFSLPIVLLILHATFGAETGPDEDADRNQTLQAFVLICLLPLAHIVAFGVLAPCLVPRLWRHRNWFFGRILFWAPAFVVGLLQLAYLGLYGPPTNRAYSSWSARSFLPLQDFAAFPPFTRGIAYWFFADGDFLFWAALFAVMAYALRKRRDPSTSSSLHLRQFLHRWRWYFAVCGAFFLLINFYRYSFDWGDSNKLVFFLNLGLALVITLGAAQWAGRRQRFWSHALWLFFFALCIGPATYSFYENVLKPGHGAGTVLLFEKNGRDAAEWIDQTLPHSEVVLTAAYSDFHFVTPLAGRPTLAGIYGESNPYRQDNRKEDIRRVYEEGDVAILPKLGVRYICVSRYERNQYKLDPSWTQHMQTATGVVFQAGEGPADEESVYIFDSHELTAPSP